MRFIIVFLLGWHSNCTQQLDKTVPAIDPTAKKLNDSAVSIAMHNSNYAKAVALLDEATQIDSNYFEAFKNKMFFQGSIKPFDADKLLVILKSLNRLRPNDPQYYLNMGVLHYKKGDSLSSTTYFNDALFHFDSILDTMHTTTQGYDGLVISKAYTLFFVGQEQKAQNLLQKLYETTKDPVAKEFILPLRQKTRRDIIDEITELY